MIIESVLSGILLSSSVSLPYSDLELAFLKGKMMQAEKKMIRYEKEFKNCLFNPDAKEYCASTPFLYREFLKEWVNSVVEYNQKRIPKISR